MPKQYSAEFRDRAVRVVADRLAVDRDLSEYQVLKNIAPKLGISVETLRRWRRDAELDVDGVVNESAELRRLRRENAEPRKVNELLKAASAFFASELDRP